MSAFSCQNCLVSALRAVIHDPPASASYVRPVRNSGKQISLIQKRHFAAEKTRRHGFPSTDITPSVDKSNDFEKTSQVERRHLMKEVKYLADPLVFAQNTQRLLAQGLEEKARQLVQIGGRDKSLVVSWNHILNHHMKQKKVNQAMKLFNEMKKRAQRPDAYTYTILLKGLADNSSFPSALDKAVNLYNSMSAPNSPVRPNLVHTNAVIEVCARAKAADTMFEIAAKLPSGGPGAADKYTFTTILHATRVSVTDEILRFGKNDERRAKERIREAITNGKKIWEDVMARWANGSITLDENLVCAMGRLLLVSGALDNQKRNQQDADDVLSLAEQAMGVPRQIPKFKWKERAKSPELGATKGNNAVESNQSTGALQQLDQGGFDEHGGSVTESTQFSDRETVSVFDPVPWDNSNPREYARPGPNALSLIITACSSLREFNTASRYWELLKPVVDPDRENCHAYLRVLRMQRASRQSLNVVEQMCQSKQSGGLGVGTEGKTYRIAMSACTRDHLNPKALETALQLLVSMEKTLETPDHQTVLSFVSLLHLRGRETDMNLALGAIEVLHKIMDNLQSIYLYGDFGNQTSHAREGRSRSEASLSVRNQSGRDNNMVATTSRSAIEDYAKEVESATARTLDLYKEELGEGRLAHWRAKLGRLRKLLLKFKSDYGKMKKHSK